MTTGNQDERKTRTELLAELKHLRKQVAALNTAKTELKASENALRDSEEKYRKLFDHAGDAIFLSDELQFIDCNKQALRMFRCSKQQLKPVIAHGNTFSPEVQPDGTDSQAKALAATGKPVVINVHIAKTEFRKGSISM